MKASIIIRTYNAQDTVECALKSALNQKFPKEEFEIIVIDDGSSDSTRQILDRYRNEPNVRLFYQVNQGGTIAANNGVKESRGEYIILLDDDDYFLPILLKELVAILDTHPDIDFVYPDYYEEADGKRKRISPKNMFETIDGGIMFRRKKLLEEGAYTPEIIFITYDLFLRTLERWKGMPVQKPLFVYCRSSESNTAKADFVTEGIKQLKSRFPHKLKEINSIRSYAF